jgi:hypothetical protein
MCTTNVVFELPGMSKSERHSNGSEQNNITVQEKTLDKFFDKLPKGCLQVNGIARMNTNPVFSESDSEIHVTKIDCSVSTNTLSRLGSP